MKKVYVEESVAGPLVGLAFFAAVLWGIWYVITEYWLVTVLVIAGLLIVVIKFRTYQYRKSLKKKFEARNRAFAKLGPMHLEDWERCCQDVSELEDAGMTHDDIRRDVLLGGKYPRPVALAVIELAQIPWHPRASRQDKIFAQIKQEADDELRRITESSVDEGTSEEAQ